MEIFLTERQSQVEIKSRGGERRAQGDYQKEQVGSLEGGGRGRERERENASKTGRVNLQMF